MHDPETEKDGSKLNADLKRLKKDLRASMSHQLVKHSDPKHLEALDANLQAKVDKLELLQHDMFTS